MGTVEASISSYSEFRSTGDDAMSTSIRWIAITAMLVTVGGLAAGCGAQAAPGETSATPRAVPVSMSRTGGFAGVNQSIEIAADGTWIYTDKRTNHSEKGSLNADQRIQLLRLVSDPAFGDQLVRAPKPDPGCADGFHYTINTGGEPRSFEDCGNGGDAPAVTSAIAAVTEATPF
jgi:hypothetical protein